MMGICLFFQALMVFLQNKGGGIGILLREMAILFAGLKPGFDASRLALGVQKKAWEIMPGETVLMANKLASVLFEYIP